MYLPASRRSSQSLAPSCLNLENPPILRGEPGLEIARVGLLVEELRGALAPSSTSERRQTD
jgi:hypothetical protein